MVNKNNDPKNVYIFGNNTIGFHGHTYSKEIAKHVSNTRKSLKMVKIKNDEYCRNNLSVNTEFFEVTNDGKFVTADEEQYFLESFNQFQLDVIYYIDIIFNNIKYFKFDEKEKYIVNSLLIFLLDYKDFIMNGQFEDEGIDIYDKLFNTDSAMNWFIENVLDT